MVFRDIHMLSNTHTSFVTQTSWGIICLLFIAHSSCISAMRPTLRKANGKGNLWELTMCGKNHRDIAYYPTNIEKLWIRLPTKRDKQINIDNYFFCWGARGVSHVGSRICCIIFGSFEAIDSLFQAIPWFYWMMSSLGPPFCEVKAIWQQLKRIHSKSWKIRRTMRKKRVIQLSVSELGLHRCNPLI